MTDDDIRNACDDGLTPDQRSSLQIEQSTARVKKADIVSAAKAWADARSAFINLPMGSPDARRMLNALSEAEAALRDAVVGSEWE